MFSRSSRASKSQNSAGSGRYQLTLAKLIVLAEAALLCFARPLFCATLFASFAWMGVFASLYPWAHLVALVIFVVLFADAVGRAQIMWKRPSLSLAKRRVEEASGLTHRPLDTVEDRPFNSTADNSLWQEHVLRARIQMKKLRWPHWKADFAKHDPLHLRYVALVLLALGLITGWGALGGRLIAAINPALGKLPIQTATIDAWITPPDYTHLPPIMIATPAGDRFQDDVIKVPEGSVLHAHLAEKDGTTPVLDANGQSADFVAEDDKDFAVDETLQSGKSIAIRRGWMVLGAWKIQVVPDTAPQIAFSEPPAASERKDLRIAYDAKDDYGVTAVSLHLIPHESMPGMASEPLDFALSTPNDKDVKRVDYKDLTASIWAGHSVAMQLIATDAVGHQSASDTLNVMLPERAFFQPIARLLIEERKKLLGNLLDTSTRNEAANLMAGLAHQPGSFGGDPLVMMALRAGAVRLVLDHDSDAALAAKDILWQAATRIEDGAVGMAEQNLKQAQQDLADALDHNANEKDVQALIDRLHQALAQYLAQLSTRMAAHQGHAADLRQMMGAETNMLTPRDLDKMLQDMKNLSATGARGAAREELQRLQQMMESLRTEPEQLSADQLAALEALKTLRDITHDQQGLLDTTFQKSHGSDKDGGALAASQKALLDRLHGLMGKMKDNGTLAEGEDAMGRAENTLKQGQMGGAVASQNEALKALRKTEKNMVDALQKSMQGFALGGTEPHGSDPFGRGDGKDMMTDDKDMKAGAPTDAARIRQILNEIQSRASDMTRSKTERDYIERLLQNF